MSQTITVREYARLTTAPLSVSSLDCAQVPVSLFNWLCRLNQAYRSQQLAPLAGVEDARSLQLDNYVGVLQSPCGAVLEILPKTLDDSDDPQPARRLLFALIAAFRGLPPRETETASLQRFHQPLNEWLIAGFLAALATLLRRGLRADYQREEHQQPFLRGQLDVARQMRQPPGRAHYFHQRYDVFSHDRPENRLIVSALRRIIAATRDAESWRLAHEYQQLLQDIPPSHHTLRDLQAWRHDRLMAHYQPLKSWCEMILLTQMPLALRGDWQGISLLFPMEKLFERYVEASLPGQLAPAVTLSAQARSTSLCLHQDEPLFELRPDILLKQASKRWVLDAKWKRLDASDREHKYRLSQADFYQLYAYGQKYLNGSGEMALIYPAHRHFQQPLAPFYFDPAKKLTLWVLPFALEGPQKGQVLHHGLTGLPFV